MATNEANVAACESIIGYVFENKLWCLQALQTSGHPLRWLQHLSRVERNDRLAVYGDAVAKAYLCKQWLGTGRSKGQWTQIEQALLANSNLSAIGYQHGLDACVILNMGTTSVSQKTMATTVEAILGAVYEDGGESALAAVFVILGLTHPFLQVVMWIHSLLDLEETSTPLCANRVLRPDVKETFVVCEAAIIFCRD